MDNVDLGRCKMCVKLWNNTRPHDEGHHDEHRLLEETEADVDSMDYWDMDVHVVCMSCHGDLVYKPGDLYENSLDNFNKMGHMIEWPHCEDKPDEADECPEGFNFYGRCVEDCWSNWHEGKTYGYDSLTRVVEVDGKQG